MKTNFLRFLPSIRVAATLSLIGALPSDPIQAAPSTTRKRGQPSSQSSEKTGLGYGGEEFHLVRTVNIFDPERRPIHPEKPAAPPADAAAGRQAYIALTGTMVTEGRSLAFFSGSQSDYSRVVPINEKIGAFTVKGVFSTHVNLERDGKPVVLVVGRQMALDGSNVTISATPPPEEGAAAPASGTSSATAPAAPSGSQTAPAPSGDKAEILRRMMERRQKEVSP